MRRLLLISGLLAIVSLARAEAPVVTTGTYARVTTNSFTVSGIVAVTNDDTWAWFAYWTGGTTNTTTPFNIGTNATYVVTNTLTGLTLGVTYQYAMIGSNVTSVVTGSPVAFLTPGPPAPATTYATQATTNAAVLNGTITVSNESAWVWFEYWKTTGNTNATTPVAVSSNATALAVSNTIASLTLGTAYEYLIVASNGVAVVRSVPTRFWTTAGTIEYLGSGFEFMDETRPLGSELASTWDDYMRATRAACKGFASTEHYLNGEHRAQAIQGRHIADGAISEHHLDTALKNTVNGLISNAVISTYVTNTLVYIGQTSAAQDQVYKTPKGFGTLTISTNVFSAVLFEVEVVCENTGSDRHYNVELRKQLEGGSPGVVDGIENIRNTGAEAHVVRFSYLDRSKQPGVFSVWIACQFVSTPNAGITATLRSLRAFGIP